MNKFIYILIIIFLIFIIKNIDILNILILFIIFTSCYIYYNIYEKNITTKNNILSSYKKFIIFKKFNNYTYNNTKNYIYLFLKKTHSIEDLENIRIIIMNNLLSFHINIPSNLKNKLKQYIHNLNILLKKYIKEQNINYNGNYLRIYNKSDYTNKFNYY